MTNFEFQAEVRDNLGKAHTRRLRRLKDQVPCVVYGAGKDAQPLMMSHKDLMLALQNEAVYSHILTLNVSGKTEKVVLKALQRHPYKAQVMHADFLRVSAKEKITMMVPVHYLNEENAPGVKASGVVSHLVTEIEIRCLPANLPEYLEVDAAHLEMDAALHLSDIPLPKGVELTLEINDDNNQPIISIHKPRAAAEPEDTDAAEANTDEEKKKEDKSEG